MYSHSPSPQLDVRRSAARFTTRTDWLESHHSFSFGPHYDPCNTHFGLLVASNDDIVQPGTGFGPHTHRDMEIVTWVLSGSLVHQDSQGNHGVIYPNLAQRMSAGRGIEHSEQNDSWTVTGERHDVPVHFLQMWVAPSEPGLDPSYEQREIDPAALAGRFGFVASGRDEHADDVPIRINNPAAALRIARLDAGASTELPDAPWLHVYVARGSVSIDGESLASGDAARIGGGGGQVVTAHDAAEVVAWEMHASLPDR